MKIVYIDVQNTHKRICARGWFVDWMRFYKYIKDHCHADIVYFAVWYVAKYKDFYNKLKWYWYTMLFKQTTIKADGSIKWNVDIDIAIRVILDMCEWDLQQAHIVTNDGDYNTLVQICQERWILGYLIYPDQKLSSILLRKITHKSIDMQAIRHLIEKQKDPNN